MKQKTKRGRPGKWGNPPKDAEEGSDQPQAQEKMQRVYNGHTNDQRISYYQGALREVIDSAREALSVYLLTEDPFPMDEITRNDQRNGTESVNPKGTIRWKKKIDRFFNAALEKNEDALALGTLFFKLDLMLHAAEGVSTKIRSPQSHLPSVLQYVIHFTDTASSLTQAL